MSAYNAEGTITRAIESCLKQTYKDFELIIINDCSTDNTLSIIQSFMEYDKRIKCLNNETNLGAGLTRRKGIENISGEYMTFLDSDDYLKSDALEVLMRFANDYDVDIVAPGYISVDSNLNFIKQNIPRNNIIQEGSDKFKPNEEDTKRFMNPMLIKSSLWENVTYSQRRFIEDSPTLCKILHYAKNIMTVNYAGYYYVQNEKSLVHSASLMKYNIYTALASKDIYLFFNSLGLKHITVRDFFQKCGPIYGYITPEEKDVYKEELQEISDFIKTLIN
jgi:glycosyltransferase involved in cell wall biosynthesis